MLVQHYIGIRLRMERMLFSSRCIAKVPTNAGPHFQETKAYDKLDRLSILRSAVVKGSAQTNDNRQHLDPCACAARRRCVRLGSPTGGRWAAPATFRI